MITLLLLLQQLPFGGMLVAEEVEAGLHPQAQIRLAQKLIDLCDKKKLQIICTTHSTTFLDALPREARLLVKQAGDGHSVIEHPSTRYAMFEMTGKTHPELIVYCEDDFARILIEESLPAEMRVRVQIQPIGSNTAIMHQGVSHIRAGFDMQSLCVLDGDCSQITINGSIVAERGDQIHINPDYILLPGDRLPPEKWVISQLFQSPYKENFSSQLGCSIIDTHAHLEALNVLPDHHEIPFTLNQRTGFEVVDCSRRMIRALASQHPQLDDLRQKIRTLIG